MSNDERSAYRCVYNEVSAMHSAMHRCVHFGALCCVLLLSAGCGRSAALPVAAGVGTNPTLVPARVETIPTVHIAPAQGWQEEATPVPAAGLTVTRFADGLDHPRWLHVLPNGDVLVAETNAPPRPARDSLKDVAMKLFMKIAGAGVPSANRISLLRDADGDGIAETKTTFLDGLNSPFGMTLSGGYLYVANTDAVVRVPYSDGDLQSREPVAEHVVDLPGGPINHHWTKDVIAHPDGTRLYATVGSNSDHGERGMQVEHERAAVLEINLADRSKRIFASGLRNPNGLAWHPESGKLWVAVNERDQLGGDLVPDYITSLQDGGFYGWPYVYYGKHADPRVEPTRPELLAEAIIPDYAVGSHTASLGLTFFQGDRLGAFRDGAFVGQHGSWNRRPRSGYKVIFVPFSHGRPAGDPVDVLTGFVDAQGNAQGRPVGVAIDRRGALLVADDVGNVVWRVAAAGTHAGTQSNNAQPNN
jgi:glucose/arabinose dehydrogenase